MQITYTAHAESQLAERGISKQFVEETLKKPDLLAIGYKSRRIAQKLLNANGKDFLLRVIYEETETILVLTAYFTKPDRYGAEK